MATVKTANVEKIEENEPKVKKFNKTTLIPCRSICNGVLYVQGPVTKTDYMFYDFDDVREVQYQDLEALIMRRANCINKPQFIVEDEELVTQNPSLSKVYDSMYTKKDLREILRLDDNSMEKAIMSLPEGAKAAILGLASTMIETGALDSISKVKVLDRIFDTKLIFTIENA